jgi:hypothetical protein
MGGMIMPSITITVTTKEEIVVSSVSDISDAISLAEVAVLYAQMARSNGLIEAPEFPMDAESFDIRRGENN